MATSVTEARAEIARIDREIDNVQAKMFAGIKRHTPGTCQAALDQHPALARRVRGLFRQRGEAQVVRDRAEYEQHLRSIRTPRTKKCRACRGTGRA